MEYISQYFVQIGLGVSMIVNLYLGYQRIQLGGYTIRKEIFEDYKERNLQLEDKIKELATRMTNMTVQMTKLETTIIEKDKHIESLTRLIENRNPQLITTLDEIRGYLGNIKGIASETNSITKNNREELTYQTDILDKQVARSNNIDNASSKKTGNPIRIEDE